MSGVNGSEGEPIHLYKDQYETNRTDEYVKEWNQLECLNIIISTAYVFSWRNFHT